MPNFEDTLDTLEGLDASHRKLYVKNDDGKYVFDVSNIEDVTGLKNAYTAQKARNRDLAERIQQMSEQTGEMDDSVLELLRENGGVSGLVEALEVARASGTKGRKDELDRLRGEMEKQWKAKVQAAESRAESAEAAKRKVVMETVALKEIVSRKGIPDLIMPALREHIKVVERDGKDRVVVIDEFGEPKIKNANGDDMGVGDLLDEWKADAIRSRMFDGISATGTGASAGNRTGGESRSSGNSHLTPQQKIEAGLRARTR